ncbi:DEAD/DEAH box helicase [Delftia sp. JD2]|uniref:DEAD/DEAH box helicase n=1 Tax=Delftia sp. JD2 TaxID=469553 RepID=UPI0009FC638C|nr:DEAD/DEAH box helicase [Delftia sp. JD2]
MNPSKAAQRYAAITLSKGKMYEFDIPEEDHLQIPEGVNLEHQFPLALGIIGDRAIEVLATEFDELTSRSTEPASVLFASQVLSGIANSKATPELSEMLRLLAAAGFYLAGSPGTSMAVYKDINVDMLGNDSSARLLLHVLKEPWTSPSKSDEVSTAHLPRLLQHLHAHYHEGETSTLARESLLGLWLHILEDASPQDFLLLSLLAAIVIRRYQCSAWTMLPASTDLAAEVWASFLSRKDSLKEFWPSQRALAEAGVLRGESAVVQMPTSAGKTKATELIIRSAFQASRTRTVIVVAPFRALCHEIANSLHEAFVEDGYAVNQLSDALQRDYLRTRPETDADSEEQKVLVVTPEKLLYAIRQDGGFLEGVGLLIYDEAHQFDTGKRGVTYELLLTAIKRSTPITTQSVLVSAVVGNADEIAEWLFGDDARTVHDDARQSRRMIAYTSFPSKAAGGLGQLQFISAIPGQRGFFVPRVISPIRLESLAKEKKTRVFPDESDAASVALYLGLKLAKKGPVAVYSRLPASASKVANEVIDNLVKRGAEYAYPIDYSDAVEVKRLHNLYTLNFSEGANLSKAAKLGVFVHHGETPHGIRLAIEHAMKESHIRFISCTSTLAQGVNLPIRYLIVNSSLVGPDEIKSRDFNNLIGRSGRAGMHEEGTIIFANASIYDEKERAWDASVELIEPTETAKTGSSLLDLLVPPNVNRNLKAKLKWDFDDIVYRLIDSPDDYHKELRGINSKILKPHAARLLRLLQRKREAIEAVESFLMNYRPADDEDVEIVEMAKTLAHSTYAYSLATEEQRGELESVFEYIAKRLEAKVPDAETQNRYGKNLLGVDLSARIDEWVMQNDFELELCDSSESLFDTVWKILRPITENSDLRKLEPANAAKDIATMWINGDSYYQMMSALDNKSAVIQHKTRRERITYDTLVSMCEKAFSFEFCLHLAAIKESYRACRGEGGLTVKQDGDFDFLLKRLKYGVPSLKAIGYFEAGFADRVIAQSLTTIETRFRIHSAFDAKRVIRRHRDDALVILKNMPAYYRSVLTRILA